MHSVDNPWWNDIVTLIDDNGPMIKRGFVNVPNAPGLGLEINEDKIKEHLSKESNNFSVSPKGMFEETSEWDELDSHDRTWS